MMPGHMSGTGVLLHNVGYRYNPHRSYQGFYGRS